MSIRLFIDSKPADVHIAGKDTSETFCGIDTETLRLVGTIDAPSGFTPQHDAVHDDCLTVFLNRHDQDTSSSGENIGWEDMGE